MSRKKFDYNIIMSLFFNLIVSLLFESSINKHSFISMGVLDEKKGDIYVQRNEM